MISFCADYAAAAQLSTINASVIMLLRRHLAAVLRALAAGFHALFHAIQLFAAFRTSVTNFGAGAANAGAESGAAEHEIN